MVVHLFAAVVRVPADGVVGGVLHPVHPDHAEGCLRDPASSRQVVLPKVYNSSIRNIVGIEHQRRALEDRALASSTPAINLFLKDLQPFDKFSYMFSSFLNTYGNLHFITI